MRLAIPLCLGVAVIRAALPVAAQVGGEFAGLERQVALHPVDTALRMRLAEAYAAGGFAEEAAAAYLAVLVRDRQSPEARARLAELAATRMPRSLPAAAAELAPFAHSVSHMKVVGADGRAGTWAVLMTRAGFLAPEGYRRDPIHGWSFPLVDYGYAWHRSKWVMRVCVHWTAGVDRELVQRVLGAVLSFYLVARERLDRDATRPNGRPVHVWLAEEGDAGARALGRDMHLYAVGTDRAPGEWVREVAHEYGHMSLPGIGGFTATSDPWADGDLAELLYVKWLAEIGQPGWLSWPVEEAERAARARREALMAGAQGGIGGTRLNGADEGARDYFLGLALRVEQSLGPRFLGEALERCPRGRAADFAAAVAELAKERTGR